MSNKLCNRPFQMKERRSKWERAKAVADLKTIHHAVAKEEAALNGLCQPLGNLAAK